MTLPETARLVHQVFTYYLLTLTTVGAIYPTKVFSLVNQVSKIVKSPLPPFHIDENNEAYTQATQMIWNLGFCVGVIYWYNVNNEDFIRDSISTRIWFSSSLIITAALKKLHPSYLIFVAQDMTFSMLMTLLLRE